MLRYAFVFLYLYAHFGDEYCNTGSVKQQRATLSILHDCSKANNDDVAELQSALPHINNYRACNDLTSRTLYPAVVLELFKKMHGKVDFYTNLDVFGLLFFLSFILSKYSCVLRHYECQAEVYSNLKLINFVTLCCRTVNYFTLLKNQRISS